MGEEVFEDYTGRATRTRPHESQAQTESFLKKIQFLQSTTTGKHDESATRLHRIIIRIVELRRQILNTHEKEQELLKEESTLKVYIENLMQKLE